MKKFILLLTIISTSAFAALSDLDKADVSSTNILKNPGFESGLADWTKTGGTWTLQSSGSKLGFGKGSLCWDSSSAGQKLKSTVATIPNALKGKNGEMKLSIQTPTGTSTHILRVTDGTNQIGNSVNVSTSTAFQAHSLNIVVPTSGGIGIEIESVASNEPEICLDLGYIGEATNLQNVAQAIHVGSLKYAKTTGCNFQGGGSGSYSDLPANATCPTPSVTGSLTAPATKIPGFKMYVSAGTTYRILINGTVYGPGGNSQSKIRMSDGTDVTEQCSITVQVSGVDITPSTFSSCLYKPTTSGLKTIQAQGNSSGASTNFDVQDFDAIFEVEQFPSQSQLAVNSLSSDSPLTSWTPTFAGTTESNVDFKWKRRGEMMFIVGRFNHNGGTGITFTLPGGVTVDSNKISSSGYNSIGTGSIASQNYTLTVLAQGGLNTLTFGLAGPSSSGNTQFTAWASELVQFTAEVPITGWDENQKAPTLVGSITSSAPTALRQESFKFYQNAGNDAQTCNSSPCSLESSMSGATMTRNAGGDYTLTWPSGTWSAKPICVISVAAAGINWATNGLTTTTTLTTFNFLTGNVVAGALDTYGNIICMGPR